MDEKSGRGKLHSEMDFCPQSATRVMQWSARGGIEPRTQRASDPKFHNTSTRTIRRSRRGSTPRLTSSSHTRFWRTKVRFPKINQELRTEDYYTLFRIHTLKDQKSSTGQLENSFDFDMKNLVSKLTMTTLRRHRLND